MYSVSFSPHNTDTNQEAFPLNYLQSLLHTRFYASAWERSMTGISVANEFNNEETKQSNEDGLLVFARDTTNFYLWNKKVNVSISSPGYVWAK